MDSGSCLNVRICAMRAGISITVSPSVRRRLQALIGNRNAPQKHVWRAEIVLLSADGVGTNEIMRRTGTSKTCVWRWQERFMEEGFDGLLRDKLSKQRLKRGVFRSVVDLQAAINRFIDDTNQKPKPFTWTADPDKIIAAVKRGHQVLDSVH